MMTRTIFPDCMMPDDAEPCKGFGQARDALHEAHLEIARLRAQVAELEARVQNVPPAAKPRG